MNFYKLLRRHASQHPVKIDYSELVSSADISSKIYQAFGKEGLGLCAISNIPNYSSQRRSIISQGRILESLSPAQKEEMTSPESLYSRGWSQSTVIYKGKTNPKLCEFRASPDTEGDQTPWYRNVWPSSSLPHFKDLYVDFYRTIVNSSLLLSRHLDSYVQNKYPESGFNLKQALLNSKYHLGNLLYYHPQNENTILNKWHTDHGLFTALASPMYFDEATGNERKDLDLSGTGLYVRDHKGETVKILFEDDNLHLQIADGIQILSGGALLATPHTVLTDGKLKGISRSTFAVFFEPDPKFVMNCPNEKDAIIQRAQGITELRSMWRPSITYEEFSIAVFK